MSVNGRLNMEPGVDTIVKADSEIQINKLIASWSTDRSGELLFPHPPVLADISQQRVGDCFYLSSLGAMITAEPDRYSLYSMMLDLQNGWVLVRFYRDVGPKDEMVLKPYYVKIQKTVPKFVGFGNSMPKGLYGSQCLKKLMPPHTIKAAMKRRCEAGSRAKP